MNTKDQGGGGGDDDAGDDVACFHHDVNLNSLSSKLLSLTRGTCLLEHVRGDSVKPCTEQGGGGGVREGGGRGRAPARVLTTWSPGPSLIETLPCK